MNMFKSIWDNLKIYQHENFVNYLLGHIHFLICGLISFDNVLNLLLLQMITLPLRSPLLWLLSVINTEHMSCYSTSVLMARRSKERLLNIWTCFYKHLLLIGWKDKYVSFFLTGLPVGNAQNVMIIFCR